MPHLWELTHHVHPERLTQLPATCTVWVVKEECVHYFLGCKQMYKMNCKQVLVSGRPKEDAEVVYGSQERENLKMCAKKFLCWAIFPTLPSVTNTHTN